MTGPEMKGQSTTSLDAFSPGREQSVGSNEQYDEDLLEQFFSDEEPIVELGEKETVNSVIKRVSKKSSQIIKGIRHCQALMDQNSELVKRYVRQGKKPNLEFRRDMQLVSEEFLRVSQIAAT